MKYIKLFEELHVSRTVEIYADLVKSHLDKLGTNFPKKFLIYVDNPEKDFPIRVIKIAKTDSYNSFNSRYSNLDSIYLDINPSNIKYSTLIHELTHAYQFFKLKSKGKNMNGFLGQFVNSASDLSDNPEYQSLLAGLYYSIPTEMSAHIAQYNYSTNNRLERWIKWSKSFSPEKIKPIISSIEDIESVFPNNFVHFYKIYCAESNFTPKKDILNLENKDISYFLQWCKKLFDKVTPILERKLLRIKASRKTIS